jgi:hypothetical protein
VSSNSFSTDLLEWQARIILECLTREEERLLSEMAISNDENAIADMDNDLIKLRMVLKKLKEEAVAKFGKDILNFNKDAL